MLGIKDPYCISSADAIVMLRPVFTTMSRRPRIHSGFCSHRSFELGVEDLQALHGPQDARAEPCVENSVPCKPKLTFFTQSDQATRCTRSKLQRPAVAHIFSAAEKIGIQNLLFLHILATDYLYSRRMTRSNYTRRFECAAASPSASGLRLQT